LPFSLMASHQLAPTTTSARPTAQTSAEALTSEAPTHSLKAPIPPPLGFLLGGGIN
jgi:hypothetical protein